ncbi:MAG: hypothetical protein IZT56_05295 [Bacteroidetes bacterium]|nr:hypothetical protein [Bacteroidota bacterium]
MKSTFLYGIMILGILSISKVTYAQEKSLQEIITGEKDTRKEDNDLQFQTFFFEALKQKAINNFGKAIENLEQCYQIDSTSLAVEFEFSKNYLSLKNYFEATIFINKALEKEPKNVHLLKHKVLVFKSHRNFSEAIKIQKQLIEINPKYTEDLVLLYIQNKEYENAKNIIVEVEENALSSTKIIGYKRYLKSRELIRKNITTSKKVAVESANLEVLKKQFEKTKAYKTLQDILNNETENALFELLYTDSKNGLELFPTQPFLYQMNGMALNKLGKYNDAIAVLTIGIDFVIDNNELVANFYEQLSISYEGLNNKNEALKYKQKATQLRLEK